MKCTICGAENLEGAAYCEDCGSKLPTAPSPEMEEVEEIIEEEEPLGEPEETPTGEIICPACGSENPAGSKFCDDCGASLDTIAAEEEMEEEVEVIEGEEGEEEGPPETPIGVAKLVLESTGEEYVLDKDIVNIGRQSPADGIFPEIDMTDIDQEAYISRRHARIIRKDDGFLFEDVGSSNGSFINNVRIAQGVQQFLNVGDEIRLGKTVMKLI
ncbi:MAG: zinc ribbon domain-containing protein [Candidatus Eremiobacteraeota bacterium]|nr:zinc ribbon domain-containing protein [Candidatus Eremiobacteraeota bacterium]